MTSDGTANTSLRERLRKQAAETEEHERQRREDSLKKEQFYEQQLLPVMLDTAKYFAEIVADLERIQPETPVTIPVGSTGNRKLHFSQSSYRLFVDDQEEPREVAVSCICQLPAEKTLYVDSLMEADEFEETLREMGVNYHRRRQERSKHDAEERSRFVIDGSFTAAFTLRADPEREGIALHTANLEDKPTRHYILQADRLTEDFLENLGFLLLREKDKLIHTQVSSEFRQELRSKIEQDVAHKRRGIKKAYYPPPAAKNGKLGPLGIALGKAKNRSAHYIKGQANKLLNSGKADQSKNRK